MAEKLEQRYCIKFCVKLGDSQVETIRKIQQAFGNEAMGTTQIKEWYNRFKDGRTSVESEARSGRPSTSRNEIVIDQVRTLLMQDTTKRYCVAFVTLCDANGWTCGQRSIGSSITITHPPILHI